MDGQLSIDEKIRDVESLPVKNRRRTDVFCGITLLCYIIALAIILIIVHNQGNFTIMQKISIRSLIPLISRANCVALITRNFHMSTMPHIQIR